MRCYVPDCILMDNSYTSKGDIMFGLQLWCELMSEVVGVGEAGDEVVNPTKLGVVATSQGLPTTFWSATNRREHGPRIVQFLRKWADQIEKEVSES